MMSKYSTKIDLSNTNSTHTKIVNLVGKDKRVIEFGCSSGFMSEVLRNEFNCEVVGIEINNDDAKKAESYCQKVILGNIEQFEWCEKLSGDSFDVAIFADVLEHLKDPKTVLKRTKDFLKKDGYILVSVPNIANVSIRLELLLGGFAYEELGILDNSHRKYFTLKSLINLIEDSSFYVDFVDFVGKDLPVSIIKDTLKLLDLVPTEKTIDYLSTTDSFAYQFIVKGLNRKPDGYASYVFREMEKPGKNAENIFQEHIKQLELADKWLREKDQLIHEQNGQIQYKDQLIQEQNQKLQKIQTELNLIKHSRVWRIAEFFRRLVYIKLLGKFPSLQKGALRWSLEGFGVFYLTVKQRGKNICQKKFQELHDGLKFLQLIILKVKRNWGKIFSKDALILDNWKSWIFKLCNEFKKTYPAKGNINVGFKFQTKCDPYEAHVRNNEIYPHIERLLRDATIQFQYKPLVSIIMPAYNVEPRWLKRAIDSVLNQIYSNWELCIADDASSNKETLDFLKSYEKDNRIKILFRAQNGNICEASNSAADLAEGEFFAFMDNDDLLSPNALFEIVRLLQDDPDCDLIYSDEDKIDDLDKRYDPQFKPDWSPELLLSYNYINHFTCIRRNLFEEVGRFRIGYEGAQDYDLILRVIEKTDKIRHIPKILYHWRAIRGSVAWDARDKPIMNISALKGLNDHLKRRNIEATAYQPEFAQSRGLPISQLDWPDNGPSIAIIIPTFNQEKLLKKCIESIVSQTTYLNYEIVVVDNDSNDEETLEYLRALSRTGIKVERIGNEGQPFSFSRINNLAVRRVQAEYILFLNNDIEILEPKWLSRMAGYLSLPGVGVTGAKLIYPNRTLQHAGVVLGMHDGIIPDHAFINHSKDNISYYFLAEVARNCSAVTGACLMTRRRDFISVGGFSEQQFKVSLQDVDYPLRLAKGGMRTVYVAGAELKHYESATRQRVDDPRELANLRKMHKVNEDAYYNINLSRFKSFEIDSNCTHTDYNEFIKTSIKVLIFTHNFELAGAPKAMYDLAFGLKNYSDGKISPVVFSPVPGPIQYLYEKAEITNRVIDIFSSNIIAGWETKNDYDLAIEKIEKLIESEKPDVLITNTIFGFYIVKAADKMKFPVIWIISESMDQLELQRSFSKFTISECLRAFNQAYKVVFGSVATSNFYELYNSKCNFQVIRNSIDRNVINKFIDEVPRKNAKNNLGISIDKRMLLMVGTICERKGQETFVEAAKILRQERNDFYCYLVGASEKFGQPYLAKIHDYVRKNNLEDVIKIIKETKDLYWYYRAADIFVFTSHLECYPLAILEAMAFGLPIVTTHCCGVHEQVLSVNAKFYNPTDSLTLAKHLKVLLADESEIEKLGNNSRVISEYQQNYQEMITKYKKVIWGAWIRENSQ